MAGGTLTLDDLRQTIATFKCELAMPNAGRIVESEMCADQVADFSLCRSPARAARRLKRGIRGRVKITSVPWRHGYQMPDGSLLMHPVAARALREKLADRVIRHSENVLMQGYLGIR